MELRDYQHAAIDAIRGSMRAGNKKVLLVVATGGGKTFIASWIILNAIRMGKKCLFVAHRKELIDQASDSLKFMGIDHGVIKSKDPRSDLTKSVQVASIQTYVRRDPWAADLVVFDESHRSAANMYQKVFEANPESYFLGLTATPYRTDGKPLGGIFEDLVEVISCKELVERGHLMSPIVYGSSKPLDLSEVQIRGGDFVQSSVDEKVMAPKILHGELLTNWAKHCGGMLNSTTVWGLNPDGTKRVVETDCDARTVVFAPTIERSKQIAQQFRDAGVSAVHIDGKTSKAERKDALDGLASGKFTVVSNVDLLNEGWDLPKLECVIAARPTKSEGLFRQMGGRVMRPDPEKRFAMIIDHADWTRWHGFLTDPREHSLSASEKREKGKKVKREKAKNCPVCKSFQKHGVSECDNCGYLWPKKEYEHTAEELQILQANGLTPKRKEPDPKVVKNVSPAFLKQQQQAFKTIASQCVQRGHSPKWAWARFKGAFGRWPTEGNGIVHPEYFKKYQEQFSKKNKEEQERNSKEAKAKADERSNFVKARQQELIGRAGKSSLKDSERRIRIEHPERKLPLGQKVVGQ